MADKKVKYDEDKVYLKSPHGAIWPYDAMLAKVEGYKAVIPNPSKKQTATPQQTQQTQQKPQQTQQSQTAQGPDVKKNDTQSSGQTNQ